MLWTKFCVLTNSQMSSPPPPPQNWDSVSDLRGDNLSMLKCLDLQGVWGGKIYSKFWKKKQSFLKFAPKW